MQKCTHWRNAIPNTVSTNTKVTARSSIWKPSNNTACCPNTAATSPPSETCSRSRRCFKPAQKCRLNFRRHFQHRNFKEKEPKPSFLRKTENQKRGQQVAYATLTAKKQFYRFQFLVNYLVTHKNQNIFV